jgi:hypothetical protein
LATSSSAIAGGTIVANKQLVFCEVRTHAEVEGTSEGRADAAPLYRIAQREEAVPGDASHVHVPFAVERRTRDSRNPVADLTKNSATPHAGLVGLLRELVVALDQRVRHVERSGEAAIACDAAILKEKALRRIAELEAARADAREPAS